MVYLRWISPPSWMPTSCPMSKSRWITWACLFSHDTASLWNYNSTSVKLMASIFIVCTDGVLLTSSQTLWSVASFVSFLTCRCLFFSSLCMTWTLSSVTATWSWGEPVWEACHPLVCDGKIIQYLVFLAGVSRVWCIEMENMYWHFRGLLNNIMQTESKDWVTFLR